MKPDKIVQVVEKLARPIVERRNLELVDVEYVKEGGHRYLRVFLDREGGVRMEDCEGVSEELGAALDRHDPIKEPYFLEVSSPGVERPLKRDRDFAKFAGRQVAITTYTPIGGDKHFEGVLQGLEGDMLRITLAPDREVLIPRGQIASARTVFKG